MLESMTASLLSLRGQPRIAPIRRQDHRRATRNQRGLPRACTRIASRPNRKERPIRHPTSRTVGPILVAALAAASIARAQASKPVATHDSLAVPALQALVGQPASEMAAVVGRFDADRDALAQRYDAVDSP